MKSVLLLLFVAMATCKLLTFEKRILRNVTTIEKKLELIYPGTKWCGDGTLAVNYEDLGVYWEADICCRDHDFCPDCIPSGGVAHGLLNQALYSSCHCDCDLKMYKCLQDANTKMADAIGRLFYNIIKTPCYKLEHPIVKCLEWNGILDMSCQKYELDYNKSKTWQFFDSKFYIVKS